MLTCKLVLQHDPENGHQREFLQGLRRMSSYISRSPSSYCIFFSSVAQSVSNGVPLGITSSSLKRPIHRRPAMIRVLSSSSANFVLLSTAAMRSSSARLVASRTLAVTSFQLGECFGVFRKSCSC